MEFFAAVEARRSVRKFSVEKVPADVLKKCLDAALLAPNSSNMQLWEFYVVQDPERKAKVVEACFSQPAASTAAELVVAVARIDLWRRNQKLMLEALALQNPPKAALEYYKKIVPTAYLADPFYVLAFFKFLIFTVVGFFRPIPRGPYTRSAVKEVAVKSLALACENFMLAASAEGFGTCPMEGFDEWRVRKALSLPWSSRVGMIIGMGKALPQGIYGPRIRFDKSLAIKFV